MPYIHALLLAIGIGVISTFSHFAHPKSQEKIAAETDAVGKQIDALKEKARANGKVTVMIQFRLQTPWEPAANLEKRHPGAATEQRLHIEKKRDALLKQMGKTPTSEGVTLFDGLPGFGLLATPEELEALRGNPDVESIREPIQTRLSLSQSVL